MARYRVLDAYENGWRVVRRGDEFLVETPSDDKIVFDERSGYIARRKARLFAALCVNFGRLPLLDDPELIPVDVAVAGKPEIAAYLWTVHGEKYATDPPDEGGMSGKLDVSPDTLSKYYRRVIRSVEDSKVGGVGR